MKANRFVGVRERGEIVLPVDIRRRHHLDQPGAQVEVVERKDGVIELRPQVAVPADQTWFWKPEWQEGERKVDAHVAAGRVKISDGVEAFLKDIDGVRTGRRKR